MCELCKAMACESMAAALEGVLLQIGHNNGLDWHTLNFRLAQYQKRLPLRTGSTASSNTAPSSSSPPSPSTWHVKAFVPDLLRPCDLPPPPLQLEVTSHVIYDDWTSKRAVLERAVAVVGILLSTDEVLFKTNQSSQSNGKEGGVEMR
mmetsp:Transcript_5153/g.6332  ORF Transcript_5153/g.6332 Transcript_5153/m.6332 type:complete len:148 (-) Transcript_5153:371-814(-)